MVLLLISHIYNSSLLENTSWYLIVTALDSSVLPYDVCFFLTKHSRSSSSPHTIFYLIVLVAATGDLGSSSPSRKELTFAVREHCQLIELLRYWSFRVMLSLSCLLNPDSFIQVGKRLEVRSCSWVVFMTLQECMRVARIQPAGCTSKSAFAQAEERCLCGCTICVHGLTAGLWGKSRVLTSLGKQKLKGC